MSNDWSAAFLAACASPIENLGEIVSTALRRIGASLAALATFGTILATPAAASTAQQESAAARGATGNAAAQCNVDFVEPGVNIRGLPNTSSTIRGKGYPGHCVQAHSSMTGENVYCAREGFWTTSWYDVTDLRTGVRGWVSSCFIRDLQ